MEDLYARSARRACMVELMSTREAARVFRPHRDAVTQDAGALGASWVAVGSRLLAVRS